MACTLTSLFGVDFVEFIEDTCYYCCLIVCLLETVSLYVDLSGL